MTPTPTSTEKTPMLTKKNDPSAITCCGHRDILWSAKAAYFAYNAAQSAGLNFLTLYWQDAAHFSKSQIGLLQTLLSVSSFLSPFWGMAADRYHWHRGLLVTTIALAAVFMFSVHFTTKFFLAACLVFSSYIQQSGVSPLLDHAILGVVARFDGDWGRQRLFAAAGWGLGAYVTSFFVSTFGIATAFYANVIMSVLTLVVLRAVPRPQYEQDTISTTEQPREEEHQQQHQHQQTTTLSLLAVMRSRSQRHVVALLMVVLCMGTMHAAIGTYLPLYLFNLSGGNAHIVGIVIFLETISELPVFFFSNRIIRHVGITKVLLLGIAAFATRLTYYAFATNAWSVLPFEMLHGLTFSLFWAASTQYLYTASPSGWEGTFLGLLSSTQFGVGSAIGTLVGGFSWQHYGAQHMWLTVECCVPVALLCVAMFSNVERKRVAKKLEEDERKAGATMV